jgi:hypothetical protein
MAFPRTWKPAFETIAKTIMLVSAGREFGSKFDAHQSFVFHFGIRLNATSGLVDNTPTDEVKLAH